MDKIFIDPAYPDYGNNKLFDASDKFLNRDDSLMPYVQLKADLEARGIKTFTYDLIKNFSKDELAGAGYVSLGNMQNLSEVKDLGLRPLAFFIMEPPLVLVRPYRALPQLSQTFDKVFVHNLEGDCIDLKGVRQESLKKLFWPQPYPSVVEKYWARKERKNAVVIINGHHRPKRLFSRELYSQRIRWGVALNEFIPVDLYGRGWDRFSKATFWTPYLFNYFGIKKIYRGPCSSKLEVMSGYDFALCFENLRMNGYITEKIFDCFYSGVIPIYRGGDDIAKWIPSSCFIDLRQFKNAESLGKYLKDLRPHQKENFRNEARAFLESSEGKKYVSLSSQLF